MLCRDEMINWHDSMDACSLCHSLAVLAEEVERCVPILPYRFAPQLFESLVDDLCCAFVRDAELLKSLRICVISARVNLRFGRHGGDTECAHVVTYVGRFAC